MCFWWSSGFSIVDSNSVPPASIWSEQVVISNPHTNSMTQSQVNEPVLCKLVVSRILFKTSGIFGCWYA